MTARRRAEAAAERAAEGAAAEATAAALAAGDDEGAAKLETALAAAEEAAAADLPLALEGLGALVFQPSESVPRPLVQNAAIEKAEAPGAYESRALPFRAHTPTELLSMAPPALEAALAAVYRSVASAKTAAERSNTLLYCESLATDARLATLLVNSAVGELVASLLRGDRQAVALRSYLDSPPSSASCYEKATFVRAGFARGALLLARSPTLPTTVGKGAPPGRRRVG